MNNTYKLTQGIVAAFGLDDDYAFVIFETFQANSHKDVKQQWQALQRNLKDVGLSANHAAFNAYNQVSVKTQEKQNNRLFAQM